MDRKGPEHHYDEVESPENGRSIFWQQGEIAPDHVKNNGEFHGEGRPYRGQPNPIEDEMDRYRDMPLDGASDDEGGNQFRTDKGILASKSDEKEDLEELDEATEPKGLGEIHPVKDNEWASGEITTRPARDEMLGSVRRSQLDEDNPIWNEIFNQFEDAEKLNEEEVIADNIPEEHLGWDLVDVVEPSKEYTEAANKYSMPIPNGITDNLHNALVELNVWVENPEENGKLRPYKQYWSAIRPKINEGSIKIGVEDPHMADIINHIARTDDPSVLDKTASLNKEAGPAAALGTAARFLAPAILSRIGMGGLMKGAGGLMNRALTGMGISSLLNNVTGGGGEQAVEQGGLEGQAVEDPTGMYFTGSERKSVADFPAMPDMPDDLDIQSLETDKEETNDPNKQRSQRGKKLSPALKYLMGFAPELAKQIMQTQDKPAGAYGETRSGDYFAKVATYGDSFDHPSTVNRRVQDPENGELFPSTRTQTVDGPLGDQEWQRDYMDVNEIGQSRSIRGDDYEQENLKRQMSSSFDDDPHVDLTKEQIAALEHFATYLPLIKEFAMSDDDGSMDPLVLSVHEALESAFPNYLNEGDDEHAMLFFIEDEDLGHIKEAGAPGFDIGTGFDGQAMPVAPEPVVNNRKPNVTDPSTGGYDPQSGPATAAGNAQGWDTQTSPNLVNNSNPLTPNEQEQAAEMANAKKQQQQQTEQNIMQQINQQKSASNHQGPHTDSQQAAVAELLIEQGREEEIPYMLEHPEEYDKENAEVQNSDPMFDEDPGDLAQEQPAPPNVPAGGMPPMPNEGMPAGVPPMGAPTPGDLNPAGAGAMQPPAMQLGASVTSSMLNAAFKYGADNVASKCPKCDSHTTKMMQQDGKSKCHACGNEWQDDAYQKSDGDSSHATTTSSFYAAMDSFVDEQINDEPEIDESSHTWTDDNGEPLQEGKEYEIYAHNYEIPDVGRVVELKPNAVVYEIESDGGLRTIIEIDREEADLNGYRFSPTIDETDDELNSNSFGIEDKIAPEPGQSTDLSTPHREIGASVKESIAKFYMCPVEGCPNNQGGGDYEPGTCSIHNVELVPAGQEKSAHKTAGKHYTPMEQRELIDEYGEARNADKLNLEGTHYAEAEDDHFLFGC